MWIASSQVDPGTRRGLTALLFNGICGFTWDALTTGAFLVGFAVAAGADNFTIGLLTAIPLLAQVLQVPAVLLLERWRQPKRMIMVIGPAGRAMWAVLALVPIFFVGHAAISTFIIILFLASAAGAFLGVAWNTWVRLMVPENLMGRYFSSRQRYSIGFAVVVGLLAGFFVDWFKGRYPSHELVAYSFVFGLGAIFAFLSLLFLFRMPARELPPHSQSVSLSKVLKEPFLDRNFRSLLGFLFLWGFAVNLAVPFFAAYILKRMGFPISTVVIFTTISQLSNILFVSAWGRLADLTGNRAVLYFAGLLLMLTILAFPFAGLLHHNILLIIVLIGMHVLGGLATGGVNLSSSNIALKLSPTGSAHTYLAANGLVVSLAGAIAPLVAGRLGDFFAARSFAVRLSWTSPNGAWGANIVNLQGLDFVFLMAVVLAAFALHRLAFVREQGAITERLGVEQVAQELTREVKGLTSIGGWRSMATFPITLTSLARQTLLEPEKERAATEPVKAIRVKDDDTE